MHKKRSEMTPDELEKVRAKDRLRPNDRHKKVSEMTDEERAKMRRNRRERYRATHPVVIRQKRTKEYILQRAREYDKKRYAKHRIKRLAENKKYRQSEAGKAVKLRQCLKNVGCTMEKYEELKLKQNGVCAICGTTNPGSRQTRLSVDHDHATGKIRGLLCQQCNSYLGHIADSIGVAKTMVKYLEENENAS